MCVRYLRDESMCAQQVQQPRDVGGATALLRYALDLPWEQNGLDVPVPKTVDLMFATQHGAEQLLLLQAEQIQTATTTRTQTSRPLHSVEDLATGLRLVHHRQGAEVAFVGRPR